MRTVHTYSSTASASNRDPQPASTSSSSSTTHSTTGGYPSVRHSLLRMHSQLRSASTNRPDVHPGPIDLSQTAFTRMIPKVTPRSTHHASTTTVTPFRPVPIITSSVPTPTHTIYSTVLPSSSTCASTDSQETSSKSSDSPVIDQIVKFLSSPPPRPPSPKLAYAYSNIEENLQCPLCIDRLRDPRALPCQHVFCCSCLKSIPTSNLPYPSIVCPLCRRTFPYHDAEQFPVSYIHRQLLELVPKNYDVNAKCRKCEEKTSLVLCSCCDYLLCPKCAKKDREIVIDNIHHAVQTCHYRLKKIHHVRDRLDELNDDNEKKIKHIEQMFENFERKFFSHKQMILTSLKRFNEEIREDFWRKLNLCSRNTTEPYLQIINKAENLLSKSSSSSFDDILSLFYNLNSMDKDLEQSHRLLETLDIQNLFKQEIQINPSDESDEQIRIHCQRKSSAEEKVFPLLPPSIFPRPSKRLRKSEPKRHIETHDELDEDGDDHDDEGETTTSETEREKMPMLKKLKVESPTSSSSSTSSMFSFPSLSPLDPLFFLNTLNSDDEPGQNDNDIIYLQTVQGKSPMTKNFDDFFQVFESN